MLFDKKLAKRQMLLNDLRRYVEAKQNPRPEKTPGDFAPAQLFSQDHEYECYDYCWDGKDRCCDMSTDGAPQRTSVRHAELKLDRAAPSQCFQRVNLKLEDFIKQKDATFSETLASMIEQRGLKNSAVYKKAHLSKQLFSKIINDPEAKPSKATAVSLAIGLELDYGQTQQFIGKAGYVLSDSSVFDLIIRYFIEKKIYDIIEINFALYEFDQPLLGA